MTALRNLITISLLFSSSVNLFGADYSVFYLKEFSSSRELDSLISKCHLLELQRNSDSELCSCYFELSRGLWNEGMYEGLEELAINLRSLASNSALINWEARAETTLGNLYNIRGLSKEALDAYGSAIELYQKIADSSALATVYSNVGVLYMEMGQDSTALTFALKSLDNRKEEGNHSKLSNSYTNLGNIYSNLGDSSLALKYYLQSLKIDFELNDSVGISMAYSNIGSLYAQSENYDKAVEFLKKSIELDRLLTDDYNLMISTYNLSEVLYDQMNFGEALKGFEESYALAQKVGSARYLFNNGKQLARTYDALGRREEAYAMLNDLIPTYDSLFSEERKAALQDLQRDFEVYRKDLENELLRQSNKDKAQALEDKQSTTRFFYVGSIMAILVIILLIFGLRRISFLNRTLRNRNELIQVQNDELTQKTENLEEIIRQNQNLVSLMVHDLKNPLAQITSLSQMDRNDDEINDLIQKASNNGLELIYDIMEVSKAESGELDLKIERVEVHKIFTAIEEEFRESAGRKDLQLIFNEDPTTPYIKADARILKRILHNLVSNAIKFSPSGKHIFIQSLGIGRQIQFSIRDEGPGFSAKDQQHIFKKYQKLSARPTGGESSTGLGLAMAKIFTELLGGTIEHNRDYKNGAEFIIRFSQD